MPARRWLILAALALARAGFGFQLQTVASIGPQLSEQFHLDYAALGGLIGAYMLPGVLVAIPGGLLARRFGERRVVGGGLLLMALGGFVCAAASGPAGIAFGRAVSGVGAVAMVVLQAKIVADWFTGRAFMLAIGLTVGVFPVGIGVAQLALAPLARAQGWPAAFVADGVLMTLGAILFLVSFVPSPASAPAGQTFALPSRRECALAVLAGAVWTFYNAGYTGFLAYVPSLLAGRGQTVALAGLVMALATWSNVPATLGGGELATRWGRTPVFLIGTAGCALGVAGIAATPWPIAMACVFGIIGALHPSVIIALGTLSTRPEHRGLGMGLFYTVYYGGVSVVPAICGWVADRHGGPQAALYTAAALSLLSLPAYLGHRALGGARKQAWGALPPKPPARDSSLDPFP